MEVTDKEYKKCNSTHPIFFSNTGNTAFRLDHPGPFYFISGASGHCEKGQRMIIKAMYHEESSPSTGDDHGHKSSASPAAVLALAVSKLAIVQFLLLLCTTASYLYQIDCNVAVFIVSFLFWKFLHLFFLQMLGSLAFNIFLWNLLNWNGTNVIVSCHFQIFMIIRIQFC